MKSEKAISPTLVFLLVMLVFLSIFVVSLYLLVGNIITVESSNDVKAKAVILVSNTSAWLNYTLTNDNDYYVHITYVNVENMTISLNVTLKAGETYNGFMQLPNATFKLGNYYNVTFIGYTTFATPFAVTTKALAVNATAMNFKG